MLVGKKEREKWRSEERERGGKVGRRRREKYREGEKMRKEEEESRER